MYAWIPINICSIGGNIYVLFWQPTNSPYEWRKYHKFRIFIAYYFYCLMWRSSNFLAENVLKHIKIDLKVSHGVSNQICFDIISIYLFVCTHLNRYWTFRDWSRTLKTKFFLFNNFWAWPLFSSGPKLDNQKLSHSLQIFANFFCILFFQSIFKRGLRLIEKR